MHLKNLAVLRCAAIHDGMPAEEIDEYIANRARHMFSTYGEMGELGLRAFYLSEIARVKAESPEIYQSALEALKDDERSK